MVSEIYHKKIVVQSADWLIFLADKKKILLAIS